MPAPTLEATVGREALMEAARLYREHGTYSAVAEVLDIGKARARRMVLAGQALAEPEPEFEVAELPSELPAPAELWRRGEEQFERKRRAEEARRLIPVTVKLDGPVAVAFPGDQHLDNPGTDLKLAREHAETIRDAEGMFAGLMGDLIDNWPTGGRLAALSGHSPVTVDEGWLRAEHYLGLFGGSVLFCIAGNHDVWNGGVHTLKLLLQHHQAPVQKDGVNVRLMLPGGRTVDILARHDWPGSSIYNEAHGPARAARFGFRGDVVICGHRHTSGYQVVQDPWTGKLSHCLRTAAYKTYDAYARENGFSRCDWTVCPVALVNPDPPREAAFVRIEFCPLEAADRLRWLRAHWQQGRRRAA